jgi:hypothetical protein
LSFHDSLVAILMFVTVIPLGMERVSGSAPRLPTKMTLFTPRAMSYPWEQFDGEHCTRGSPPQYSWIDPAIMQIYTDIGRRRPANFQPLGASYPHLTRRV